MNIMITGCAGFIGSHAADLFIDSGYSVVGVDSLTYAGKMCHLRHCIQNEGFTFFKEDIVKTERIITHCLNHNVEWIINFAAETSVDNSIVSCERFIHSNVNGVRSLLDTCREMGTKLLQISTDEVYGPALSGEFYETAPMNPTNPYSATKAAAEHLITSYKNTYGIDSMTVRMSNVYGSRQHAEKFMETIFKSIRDHKTIPLYGNGECLRNWLYVEDCVRMIKTVLEKGDIGNIYNVTFNNEIKNIDLVKKILKISGNDFKTSVEFVEDRLGHDLRYAMNNKKIMTIYNGKESNMVSYLMEALPSV